MVEQGGDAVLQLTNSGNEVQGEPCVPLSGVWIQTAACTLTPFGAGGGLGCDHGWMDGSSTALYSAATGVRPKRIWKSVPDSMTSSYSVGGWRAGCMPTGRIRSF